MQRLEAEVHTRRDHAAHIGPVMGHDIKGGRGAEIDHNQIAAMALIGTGCIDQPVGADLGAGIDPWRVACYLRSTHASAEAIAQQLGERCDPRCAPTREVVRGAWLGRWTAADVRALLGE